MSAWLLLIVRNEGLSGLDLSSLFFPVFEGSFIYSVNAKFVNTSCQLRITLYLFYVFLWKIEAFLFDSKKA